MPADGAQPGHSQQEPLVASLEYRHQNVTDLTRKYYRGDVIPPTSRSQIISAQKFSALYHCMVNVLLFAYAFHLHLFVSRPDFGGLDPRDVHATGAHVVIMFLVILAPLLGCCVTSGWNVEFYVIGFSLAWLEMSAIVFVVICWSPGLPVLLVVIVSNLVNTIVGQLFWKDKFTRIVRDLQELVPPPASQSKDNTTLELWPGLSGTYADWWKLWGFSKHKTPSQLYDERCGIFSSKQGGLTHTRAMQLAYFQAIDPKGQFTPWTSSPNELWSGNILGLFDGLLSIAISNAAFAFAGLWLGKALFVNWFHGSLAVGCAALMILLLVLSVKWTTSWLEDALGVAVAEKEWLAHDVVKHSGEREVMMYDVLDTAARGNSPNGSDQMEAGISGLDFMTKGRINLVFMWISVAAVADFLGESHLAKLYWNLAAQSRTMVEAMTPYDFKLFAHARWEVTHKATLLKTAQTFMMAWMTCVYFGTYPFDDLPTPVMAAIGAACFIQSILQLMEAVQFAFSILGAGANTQRQTFVSEWIFLVAALVVLINVAIWLYLVPIVKMWDLPVGNCKADINQMLFPSACARSK